MPRTEPRGTSSDATEIVSAKVTFTVITAPQAAPLKLFYYFIIINLHYIAFASSSIATSVLIQHDIVQP